MKKQSLTPKILIFLLLSGLFQTDGIAMGMKLEMGGKDSNLIFGKKVERDVHFLNLTSTVHRDQLTITGIVTDTSGEPLAGATVLEKGTTNGTMTDFNGAFSIAVSSSSSVLVISYVGMQKIEQVVGSSTTLNFQMSEDAQALDEVLVIGYGTQQRRDVTGAISSISDDDLEKSSIKRPDEALKGKVAGVQVRNNSNAPGGGISVRIRGTASLSAGGTPLYVIDGMPISTNLDTGRSGDAGTYGAPPNPLNSIDPSDIASIQILKDASASAIYGSRAANGVVLITTRRGQYNQQNMDIEISSGIAELSNKLPFLNGRQWAEQANERAILMGQEPVYSSQDIEQIGDGTDWQDEIFRTALQRNYKVSFSGGNDKTRYLLSQNVTQQEGIIKGSHFNRYGTTINVDTQLGERLKVGESLMFTISENKIVPTDTKGYEGVSNVIDALYEAPPTIPARDENGDPTLLAAYPLGGGRENPLTMTDNYKQIENTTRVIGNVFADYQIRKSLSLNLKFGFDINEWRYHEYFPIGSEASGGASGKARQSSARNINISQSNILTYSPTINDNHRLTILGGYTYQRNLSEDFTAASHGYPMDNFQYNNLGLGSNIQAPGSNKSEWTLVSYLARVNYTLFDKYFLAASIRADGSSKFGANNKYGYFPSVSAGWSIADEKFISDLDVFSQLKLRASYGQTGNEDIGSYRSLSLLGTSYGRRSSYIYGTSSFPIAFPNNIPNPDLSWEKTSEYNAGLDVGLFRGRLGMSIDYYYKKTTDLLLSVPIPTQAGFGSVLKNTGAMLNKGVELGLNTVNFEGEFSWTSNFNIAFNRNEILSLGGAPFINAGWVGGGNVTPHGKHTVRLEEGRSIGQFYGSVYEGIWQSQEEIDAVGTMPSARPGDIRYKDVNGDGTYDTENDDVFLGNPNPDFSYGFTNDLSYKNLSLHIFMYGEQGNEILNLSVQQTAWDGLGVSAKRLDRWSESNLDGRYNSARGSNPTRVMSELVEDGSFLRIQNVTLGYKLPIDVSLFGRPLQSAHFSLGVDNLAVFTKYSGYDPEVNSYGNSNMTRGMDRFGYPPSRTYRLSLSLKF
ncbi:TonB-dependent receptor [Muricauda sp. CAU 1633]|uniref:SusC/RagA family TonB-linked outer membrane protein n=1 Tax=Allomuricauda sp. CAU 1633 TaxID=2816036 RepID=UPI001A8D98F5|nr:TonB-dependent receptor [Muricauda sp. CAU 1633]MBO0321518.1 TonB-dependent receptor [Muricauda sp. CAU 1633]